MLVGSHHVSTDDAYVNADVADVTPLVSGPIIAAPATDTKPVKAGDVLVVIDPADFRLALAQDEAALGQAERRVEGYFGARDADAATTVAKGAEVERARAQLASADADLAKAQTDLSRRQKLAGDGAVSGDELTIAENRLREATAAVGAAQAALAEAQAQRVSAAGQARAASALVEGADVAGNPEVAAAQAKVDQAKLDLARTVIRAPVDGVVAKNVTEIGQRVETGAQLMTIVPIAAAYVDANFKEGQLRRMRLGQPVDADQRPLWRRREVPRHGSWAWPAAPARPSPSSRPRTPPATGSRSSSACRCASRWIRRSSPPIRCGSGSR